jgi:hypothetical protein
MRIALVFLALAGCSGGTAVTNTANNSPPAPPARAAPGPDLAQYRNLLDGLEAPFRARGAVTAHLGEEVMVGDIRVKPLEVVEDPRCAIDEECMASGPVRLRVQIGGSGSTMMVQDQPVAVPGGPSLTLTGVMPPRWENPPAGVDPHEAPRFAFRMGGAD